MSFIRRAMVYLGLVPEDYEYEDETYLEADEAPIAAPTRGHETDSGVRTFPGSGPPTMGSSTVTPIPTGGSVRTIQSTRPKVVAPNDFKDAQEVGDRYKNNQPVIINLQDADDGLRRRLIDFCSGLTYALEGNMEKVAKNVFLLTPANVEISAEARRRLQEDGFNGR